MLNSAQSKELQAAIDELLARNPHLRRLSFKRMNVLVQKLAAQLFGI
jgi:hypothetical protein